ncbi:phosphoribosyltransferase family protein [Geminicoccaceae bacterium 1502E]|nr:phosphoribosyltransferase family protein [Geminicoccaceae bacterium 1502E]
MFADRRAAGRALAVRLEHLRDQDVVVLALPRGGVPVGYEVAKALDAPLDVLLVRKIGTPLQPELAAGAVVNGAHPVVVLNEDVVQAYAIDDDYLQAEVERQAEEIERRRRRYCAGHPPVDVTGRVAVVIDDGIATGATVRAALQAVHRLGPRRLILAAPVAPPESVRRLRREADEVVVLETPAAFAAIGQFYRDFHQLEDIEVIELLDDRARELAPRGGQPAAPA